MRTLGDRAFFIDTAAIVAVSVAICLASQDLALMSWLVPLVLATRLALWMALPDRERDITRRGEVLFYAVCTVVGAFNDWSSVTRYRIYDYTVPTDLPGVSHIPIWMLLFWGMILRFFVSVFHYHRLELAPANGALFVGRRRFEGGALRLTFLVALVVLTRQSIYRSFAHPLWSWLPFAVALLAVLVFARPDRRRITLVGAVMLLGPLVEALYINVGHLHAYRLGWFGGVPLWIALWWGLAALLWEDIGTRVQRLVESVTGDTHPVAT